MSIPISSPAVSELVVAHTLPAKAQRRRSNATAGETQHVLKWSPGRATSIRLPSPSPVKVSITGPYSEEDSFPTTTYVADDPQVTVSVMDPADEATGKSLESPIGKITITVLKGDDINPKGARLTFLGPISEGEVTVPVEKKAVPEPLRLSEPVFTRPSRVPERSVLPRPALCDGPAISLEPVFTRAPAPPMRLYKWEPEEAHVSMRRDSEISRTGYDADYERDGKGDASFTVEEEVKHVSIRRDSMDSGYDADYERDNEVSDPGAHFTMDTKKYKDLRRKGLFPASRRLPRRVRSTGYDADYKRDFRAYVIEEIEKYHLLCCHGLFPARRLPRRFRRDSFDYLPGDYMARPSNPYSSDEDDDLHDIATSPPRAESDSDESGVPLPSRLPLFPVMPPRTAVQLFEKVKQWVRGTWVDGTKRRREESPERDVDGDEFDHVAKKPKLMAVYAH